MRASWNHTLAEHLDLEAETIARAAGGAEAAGLIERFLGKARP